MINNNTIVEFYFERFYDFKNGIKTFEHYEIDCSIVTDFAESKYYFTIDLLILDSVQLNRLKEYLIKSNTSGILFK